MKEKILGFFGLLGFAMVFGAAIISWIVNSFFSEAKVMAIGGILLLVIVSAVGLFFREKEPIPWDENWKRIKSLF